MNQKGEKRHGRMPGNKERECQRILGEGNKAVVGNKYLKGRQRQKSTCDRITVLNFITNWNIGKLLNFSRKKLIQCLEKA